MKPETPILMLSLLIPVTADTNPEQVLNIIGSQVAEALQQLRALQEAADPETISQSEFVASISDERVEAYSDETKEDLLVNLGYTSKE